jgi:hypothetical protein
MINPVTSGYHGALTCGKFIPLRVKIKAPISVPVTFPTRRTRMYRRSDGGNGRQSQFLAYVALRRIGAGEDDQRGKACHGAADRIDQHKPLFDRNAGKPRGHRVPGA